MKNNKSKILIALTILFLMGILFYYFINRNGGKLNDNKGNSNIENKNILSTEKKDENMITNRELFVSLGKILGLSDKRLDDNDKIGQEELNNLIKRIKELKIFPDGYNYDLSYNPDRQHVFYSIGKVLNLDSNKENTNFSDNDRINPGLRSVIAKIQEMGFIGNNVDFNPNELVGEEQLKEIISAFIYERVDSKVMYKVENIGNRFVVINTKSAKLNNLDSSVNVFFTINAEGGKFEIINSDLNTIIIPNWIKHLDLILNNTKYRAIVDNSEGSNIESVDYKNSDIIIDLDIKEGPINLHNDVITDNDDNKKENPKDNDKSKDDNENIGRDDMDQNEGDKLKPSPAPNPEPKPEPKPEPEQNKSNKDLTIFVKNYKANKGIVFFAEKGVTLPDKAYVGILKTGENDGRLHEIVWSGDDLEKVKSSEKGTYSLLATTGDEITINGKNYGIVEMLIKIIIK
ncbi:MAG: hypothetical protein Q4A42_06685 [Tissierellia bacterium]|nr:hypothetical protein [Tissierellia bacterium]